MLYITNYLKAIVGLCLILLQASTSWCADLSGSLVKIYSDAKYLCAGTLVKDDIVVTLATCLIKKRIQTILYVEGNDPAFKNNGTLGWLEFLPLNYAERNMDVGVIVLEKSIAGPTVKPAKLCSKKSIEHDDTVILNHWDTDGTQWLYDDDIGFRNLTLRVHDDGTSAKTDTIFYAYPENMQRLTDRGGLAAIDGEFCGIHQSGPGYLDSSQPATFTSLANQHIITFIEKVIEHKHSN